MGATHGTITYRTFYLHDTPSKAMRDRYLEAIETNAFQPLDPTQEENESIGWVVIDQPLKNTFSNEDIFIGQFLNLSLRHDKYVIPSSLVNAHYERAENDYLLAHDKKRLTKFEKDDLLEAVFASLKEKTFPRMSLVDMSWDLGQNRVRFFSQSNKISEIFQGLFFDTFGLEIYPASPFQTAYELGFTEEELKNLTLSEPAQFAEGQPGVDF